MLGKLTKYEFKATARVLLPAYLALLLVTVLGKVLLAVPPVQEALNGAIAGFFVVIYMLMIMGVLFLTFFISVQRFYKNLLGDEGYLMHTLPVKVSTHIWAKLLTSGVWYLASGVLVVAAILLLAFDTESLAKLPGFFAELFQALSHLNINGWLFLVEFSVLLLAELLTTILMFYVSMAIGQLFGRQKLLGSILTYIGITFVLQIVAIVAMAIVGAAGSDFFFKMGTSDFMMDLQTSTTPLLLLHGALLTALVINLLCGAGCFLGTRYLLAKKLNLE